MVSELFYDYLHFDLTEMIAFVRYRPVTPTWPVTSETPDLHIYVTIFVIYRCIDVVAAKVDISSPDVLPVVAAGGEPRATVPALVAAALLDGGGGPAAAVKLVSILTADWLIPCQY